LDRLHRLNFYEEGKKLALYVETHKIETAAVRRQHEHEVARLLAEHKLALSQAAAETAIKERRWKTEENRLQQENAQLQRELRNARARTMVKEACPASNAAGEGGAQCLQGVDDRKRLPPDSGAGIQ
jgi:uncharacterized protein YhaN